jgi:hypothetical protein
MAATNYTSRNILWSAITALADGDLVTMTLLYNEALQRLHDGQGALLGRVATVYSDLVSQATGTKARIVGNVNMTASDTAFNYNGGIALSGLTVIVDENTTTAQTCTFSNAVTGPDVLLAQLAAQCPTNLIWSLNDSGQLVCECQTTGGTSTIALGAGTAHSTIWPSPTITTPGAGTVNDGVSRIGSAAIGSIPAGTLRSILVALESAIAGTATDISDLDDLGSKAWGRFVGSSVGADNPFAIVDHEGITSAIAKTAGYVLVTFAEPFADTNLVPMVTSLDGTKLFYYVVDAGTITTTTCRVYVYSIDGDLDPADPSAGLYKFAIDVKGRR